MWEPLIHLGRGWTVFTIVCKGGYFISILWKCLPPITGHRPNSVTNSLLILNPSLRWLKHSFLVCRWEKKIKTCSIYLIEAQGISNKIMYKKKALGNVWKSHSNRKYNKPFILKKNICGYLFEGGISNHNKSMKPDWQAAYMSGFQIYRWNFGLYWQEQEMWDVEMMFGAQPHYEYVWFFFYTRP